METIVEEFDFKKYRKEVPHSFTLLCSKRKSGKTFSLTRIIYDNFKDVDNFFVFSTTSDINGEYAFINKRFHYKVEDAFVVIPKIFERQKQLKQLNKKNEVCIIFDDINIDTRFSAIGKLIDGIAIKGRHLLITCFVSVQDVRMVSPALHENTDLLILFRTNNERLRQVIKEYYLGHKVNKEEKEAILNINKNIDYVAIIIANYMNKEENVFWYKANKAPEFKAGNKSQWLLYSDK